ncbi:MAG TPA: fatty acyl-AMP ligase [Kamptonema sp.]|nr:fatty acyl-AMP ligase [Kamptonema sp.]
MERPVTLLNLLNNRAELSPEKIAYRFLADGSEESACLTYGELQRQAQAIAIHLKPCQGSRALLVYESCLEFISAFFGCLYAGVIAVPVNLPRRNQKLARLLAIATDADAELALTTSTTLIDFQKRWQEEEAPTLTAKKWIATDQIATNTESFDSLAIMPEHLAFLQYTSGSTGTPKGVMVSHGNIIHNEQMLQQVAGHSQESVIVGWLPLFHDMGLIGPVLHTVFIGSTTVLMPPIAFLQQPQCWLEAISRYRACTSGAPNFAYDYCVQKIQPETVKHLDLSCWEIACNGAETIRAETINAFAEKFAICGFQKRTFYPCYGLAEVTCFATGGKKQEEPIIRPRNQANHQEGKMHDGDRPSNSATDSATDSVTDLTTNLTTDLVSSGQALLDMEVKIVDPETLTLCLEGQVGEIWMRGGSVTLGYWQQPEATAATFQARFQNSEENFLRTGDLGFLSEGELFVTGRLKNVLIIRGQNYYPQDLEFVAQRSHPALSPHGGAAFTVNVEGEDKLVLVQEVQRQFLRKLNPKEAIAAIQASLMKNFGLRLYQVVLIKPGSLPKTSSGKIQHYQCRSDFLAHQLSEIDQ